MQRLTITVPAPYVVTLYFKGQIPPRNHNFRTLDSAMIFRDKMLNDKTVLRIQIAMVMDISQALQPSSA